MIISHKCVKRSMQWKLCILMFALGAVLAYTAILWWTLGNSMARLKNHPNRKTHNQEIREQPAPQQHNKTAFRLSRPIETRDCHTKYNLAFLKCMKCGTETIANLIRRFGFNEKLSFVTPIKQNIYLGWPYLMQKGDYRPSSKGFNMLVEHAVYNRSIFQSLLPNNTIYFSMIREPFKHFQSVMSYFQITKIVNISTDYPLFEFLYNPEKYETIYKSPLKGNLRDCVPDGFSVTKNPLSHCLGMPLGFPSGSREDVSHNSTAIQQYIKKLDNDLDFMLIMEYYIESMVLFRRKMCWNHFNVLYKKVNQGNYTFINSPKLFEMHMAWSRIDYILYDHFNRTFWAEIYAYGDDFIEEVNYLSKLVSDVTSFCRNPDFEDMEINRNRWSEGFVFRLEHCHIFSTDFLHAIQSVHDEEEKMELKNMELDTTIPKPQGLC